MNCEIARSYTWNVENRKFNERSKGSRQRGKFARKYSAFNWTWPAISRRVHETSRMVNKLRYSRRYEETLLKTRGPIEQSSALNYQQTINRRFTFHTYLLTSNNRNSYNVLSLSLCGLSNSLLVFVICTIEQRMIKWSWQLRKGTWKKIDMETKRKIIV